MYTTKELAQVRQLRNLGYPKRRIASLLGMSRSTVRAWLAEEPKWVRGDTTRRGLRFDGPCPACGIRARASRFGGRYSYLLGMYLGDGYIATHKNGVHRLRISCCDAYPNIILECVDALTCVLGVPASTHDTGHGVIEVSGYSNHWPCAFPQHGPGRKHEREIMLEAWQHRLAAANAEEFLRGLIHSDGCRSINRVHVRGRWYEYPRYSFSNMSREIHELFRWACDLKGVAWSEGGSKLTYVSRRESVAVLDQFIGPKA